MAKLTTPAALDLETGLGHQEVVKIEQGIFTVLEQCSCQVVFDGQDWGKVIRCVDNVCRAQVIITMAVKSSIEEVTPQNQ